MIYFYALQKKKSGALPPKKANHFAELVNITAQGPAESRWIVSLRSRPIGCLLVFFSRLIELLSL